MNLVDASVAANGIRLGHQNAQYGFNLKGMPIASWRMRTKEPYTLYIAMGTANGFRYVSNTAAPTRRFVCGSRLWCYRRRARFYGSYRRYRDRSGVHVAAVLRSDSGAYFIN